MLIQPNDSKMRSLTFLLQVDFSYVFVTEKKLIKDVKQGGCECLSKKLCGDTQGTDLGSTLFFYKNNSVIKWIFFKKQENLTKNKTNKK